MENNSINEGKENSSQKTFMEKVGSSLIVKIFIIFFLMLILLIPLGLIGDLISERNTREESVSTEIARKWGMDQVVASPIIAVPYEVVRERMKSNDDGSGFSTLVTTVVTEYAFLMADQAQISATVEPQPLKRGIYQAIVYNSKINIKGNFRSFDLSKLKVEPNELKWNQAKLIFGIQDLKGLSASPTFKWDGKSIEMGKYDLEIDLFPQNLTVDIPLEGNESLNKPFEINFDLKGSKSLNFLPLAKNTKINASGNWANPSFNGNFLPDEREVNSTFKASWNIPDFSRKQAQQWTGEPYSIYTYQGIDLSGEDAHPRDYVGPGMPEPRVAGTGNQLTSTDYDMVQVNFLPQVDNYQKTTRVTKYGALVIALTFVSLVFMEIIKKQRVHIIQYVLIGFAMVLFYALLLAISEHIGFNFAYLIAAIATIVLISSFIKAITKDLKSALNFAAILALFYSFIFVLLQLRDYSLIVGTIGLFIILAVLMKISTKINWYQFEKQ